MNEPKHTPGPWKYSADFSENGDRYTDFSIYAGDMNVIGACGSCGLPTICSEANARLIAAAPELLEALKALHHAVCGETGFAEAVRNCSGIAYPWEPLDAADLAARAAIAKAEGSTYETP